MVVNQRNLCVLVLGYSSRSVFLIANSGLEVRGMCQEARPLQTCGAMSRGWQSGGRSRGSPRKYRYLTAQRTKIIKNVGEFVRLSAEENGFVTLR